jgi:multidrug efflux pump subunit AcrB
MARNGVAANLLLFFLIAAGVFSLGSLVQEVFPEFSLDTVTVSVAYPGATPEEVEESIVRKIEEQIEAVEGIDEITATAAEGVGTVSVALKLGADVSQALDDIKAEVDQITTFPEGAERPEVRELTNRQSVLRLAVYGDASERTIKEIAYRVEDALSELDEVSYVETSGIRNYEISIEVPEARLRALGLTLGDVATAVRLGSLDLSAGSIETSDEEVRVRTLGQNYDEADFEEIIVVSRSDGTTIRLGDIASVDDGFEDSDLETSFNGQPSALVEVFRTSDERVLEIVEAVRAELDDEIVPGLPAGVSLEIWDNSATVLRGRLGLLIKNAFLGLSLVLIALTLFLDIRLAFWTAVGIGVSFVGTLAVMLLLGVSINVISLFGFILAVGIVVDDAIVVGENIFAEREGGAGPLDAAIGGATRIRGPVTFAILTTVVAFTPLLFVPGTLGKILGAIPVVVISVLLLSLVESLFILPNHLSHLPPPGQAATNRVTRFFERLQGAVDKRLQAFIHGPLERALRFATGNPSIVMASATGLIILAIATVPAGILRVSFFPPVGGDVVTARLEMPEGTTIRRSREVTERLVAAVERAEARLDADRPDDAPPLVESVYVTVGSQPAEDGPGGGGGGPSTAAQAGVQVKLLEAERRDLASSVFEDAWRDEVGPVPVARSLTFTSSIVGAGAAVQVELSHPEPARLEELSRDVVTELERIQGVYDIQTDADAGLREIQVQLLPAARTLGLTLDDVARQVRAAFFGQEALRVQRGREDVRVYVRLPEDERDAIADVEQYRIRTPTGQEVPLARVAEVSFGTSPTTINRKDGQRVLTVSASVDEQVTSSGEISGVLTAGVLAELTASDPRLSFQLGGEQEQQRESFGAIGRGFLLALFVIYALLAIPFNSYVQPLIIMAAIPFGIVGAILGHLILNLPIGLLSLFGIIGLSGVVVNDSLVMIDFINERRTQGADAREAIIEGAKARFRPILLTSLTTFLGVGPLVFEQSVQAQFLIPMAASLGFGIVFATGVLMLVVPALMALQVSTLEWWARVRDSEPPEPATVGAAPGAAGD